MFFPASTSRYFLPGKQIGKGSQGVVHLCHHRESGACKAVKAERARSGWISFGNQIIQKTNWVLRLAKFLLG